MSMKLSFKTPDGEVRAVDLSDVKDNLVLGRDRDVATLVIPDPQVSRAHCALRRDPKGFILEDLGSRNGTWLNGKKIASAEVKPRDKVKIGRSELTFELIGSLSGEYTDPLLGTNPIAVAIPVYLMYRALGLNDTHLGLILLYTVVNLSLSVWLLKGFIDEIPREYEEAALIDGYTRFQAFRKVVLPQAATGIASTAIFCLIFAWNEYAFAVLLTSGEAQTAPPFIPTIIGIGKDWPAVAAGTTLFLIPVMVFTILLRKHLLRGITFGAVRK